MQKKPNKRQKRNQIIAAVVAGLLVAGMVLTAVIPALLGMM